MLNNSERRLTPTEQVLSPSPFPRTRRGESDKGEEVSDSELIGYLSKLGLGDDHIAKLNSLLLAAQSGEATEQVHGSAYPMRRKAGNAVTLFLAEEQEILRKWFLASFNDRPSLTLVGSSDGVSSESLISAGLELRPQVVVLGVKELQPATVEMLDLLHEACPEIGLVLLFSLYSQRGMSCLKEFSRDASGGRAYLPKHTIDTIEQLEQTVHWVARGSVIIDPSVMEGLFKTEETLGESLDGLSPKTIEVLKWLAMGHNNQAIADILSRDTKTIERHINKIYSTFDADDQSGLHPRVNATLMYLRAVGLITTE
jgi:DNA-binding NarL/FixJ family response regulator